MSGSGRETLPDVRLWLGGPLKCPGVVKSSSRKSGRPSRMSGSFWEALPNYREWSLGSPGGRKVLPVVREWLVGPHEGSEVVGSPTLMFGCGWEALPVVCEWSGGHLGCPRVVGRLTRMSKSGRDVLTNVWEWSVGPPGGPEVVGRHFRMFGCGWVALPDSGSSRKPLPEVREFSGGPPR